MKVPDFRIPRSSVQGSDDESLCWAVVERIWPDITCENELAHIGGLQQFFANSSGLYWRHVMASLELLGASEHLTALAVVLTAFPNAQPSMGQGERQAVLKSLPQSEKNAIRSVEDAVYLAGGFEQTLTPLWKRYIELHPEEFFAE